MSSVVPLRSMRNEASEWLARLQSEYATEEDRRQFEAWAAADPERRKVYAELAGSWRRLESLRTLVNPAVQSAKGPRRSRRRWLAIGTAAGVAALVGATTLLLMGARTKEFQTAIGEQRRISLPDTSTVELNTNSRVAVDFKESERLVLLERGEARFKVAQQSARPFIVRAAGRLIRAVGTEFNVRIEGDRVDVLVVEGAVSFTDPADASPIMVRAGQASTSSHPKKAVFVAPDELERKLAWHDGMVSFQGETLREVLAELGRYNPVQFVLADEAAAKVRVSGYFRATDVPTFLTRLEENFPLEVRPGPRETTIASRAPVPPPQ